MRLNCHLRPAKELLIADRLPCAVTQEQHRSADDFTDEKAIYALEPTEVLSTETLERLKNETQKDERLQLLFRTHKQGCPQHRKRLHVHLMRDWPLRHIVAVREGVLFAGKRIILSAMMRNEMLQKLHVAHLRMQQTKTSLARKHFY